MMSHGTNQFSRWEENLLDFNIVILLSMLCGIVIMGACVGVSLISVSIFLKNPPEQNPLERVIYKSKEKLPPPNAKELKQEDDFIKSWNNIMSYDPNEVHK